MGCFFLSLHFGPLSVSPVSSYMYIIYAVFSLFPVWGLIWAAFSLPCMLYQFSYFSSYLLCLVIFYLISVSCIFLLSASFPYQFLPIMTATDCLARGCVQDGILLHTNIKYLQLTSINSYLSSVERQNLHTYSPLQDRTPQPAAPLAC